MTLWRRSCRSIPAQPSNMVRSITTRSMRLSLCSLTCRPVSPLRAASWTRCLATTSVLRRATTVQTIGNGKVCLPAPYAVDQSVKRLDRGDLKQLSSSRYVGLTGGQIFHEMMVEHGVKHICKSWSIVFQVEEHDHLTERCFCSRVPRRCSESGLEVSHCRARR